MDTKRLLAILDKFCSEFREELLQSATATLSDEDLEIALDELRARDARGVRLPKDIDDDESGDIPALWADKNDETLERIAAGGKSRGEAFAALTNGNNVIRAVLADVLGVGAAAVTKK